MMVSAPGCAQWCSKAFSLIPALCDSEYTENMDFSSVRDNFSNLRRNEVAFEKDSVRTRLKSFSVIRHSPQLCTKAFFK
jgi:hypothetical protein